MARPGSNPAYGSNSFSLFKPHVSDHLLLHGVISLFTVFTCTTPLGVYGKLSETTYM